jgi:hypothetical protein
MMKEKGTMRSRLLSSVLGVGLVGLALSMPGAEAGSTILVFGQDGIASNFKATNNGALGSAGGTSLSATDIKVTITAIAGAYSGSTPITTAYFDLSATSTINAYTDTGGHVVQDFTGTFSITSGTGGAGTNYLSGTFTDVGGAYGTTVSGSGNSLVFSASSSAITFTSSDATLPLGPFNKGMSLAFTSVDPIASINTSESTLGAFTSNVGGNFSAAVPEPTSLALLGIGLTGFLAFRRCVRRNSVV